MGENDHRSYIYRAGRWYVRATRITLTCGLGQIRNKLYIRIAARRPLGLHNHLLSSVTDFDASKQNCSGSETGMGHLSPIHARMYISIHIGCHSLN